MPIVINDMLQEMKIKLLTENDFISVEDVKKLIKPNGRLINQDTPIEEQLKIPITLLDASGNPINEPIVDNNNGVKIEEMN
jgi:hypothetical protein